MPRTTSATFTRAVFSQETDETVVELLTLEHDLLPTPIRLARYYTNISSRSNTYTGCQFDLVWPQDKENEPPQATLQYQNISRDLIAAIRTLRTPMTATIEAVLASSPDVVEVSYSGMNVVANSYNVNVVEFTLSFERFTQEGFPGKTFGPANFPGIFK
jgi:hypothetical protein